MIIFWFSPGFRVSVGVDLRTPTSLYVPVKKWHSAHCDLGQKWEGVILAESAVVWGNGGRGARPFKRMLIAK